MSTIDLSQISLQLPGSGARILTDLNLQVPASRITWLVGESGAGKSTLCNLLAGLTAPRARVTGRLELGEASVGERKAPNDARRPDAGKSSSAIDLGTGRGRRRLARLRRRGELAWAPQNAMDTFPPHLRLREWFRWAGIDEPDLSPFGLENSLLDRLPHELSGGQISRVSLGACVSHSPRLLVCDEPTAGLDLGQADSVVAVLDDCARTNGAAVLAVTHDLSGMARNARPDDRVAVIFAGHVVDTCSVGTFLSATGENPYSRALAAAAPGAGARPLPLVWGSLGDRGYRDGDELRRLRGGDDGAA